MQVDPRMTATIQSEAKIRDDFRRKVLTDRRWSSRDIGIADGVLLRPSVKILETDTLDMLITKISDYDDWGDEGECSHDGAIIQLGSQRFFFIVDLHPEPRMTIGQVFHEDDGQLRLA